MHAAAVLAALSFVPAVWSASRAPHTHDSSDGVARHTGHTHIPYTPRTTSHGLTDTHSGLSDVSHAHRARECCGADSRGQRDSGTNERKHSASAAVYE